MTLAEYARCFIGKAYLWGNEGPAGFDCSGLVQEILRSRGIDPPGDQTAQMLHDYFKTQSGVMILASPVLSQARPGALVFYGKDASKITHVALIIDPGQVIEAGGGGADTTTLEAAQRRSAMVRVRPWNYRKDFVSCLMPWYPAGS